MQSTVRLYIQMTQTIEAMMPIRCHPLILKRDTGSIPLPAVHFARKRLGLYCARSDTMSKLTYVKDSGPFGDGSYCRLSPI